MFTRDLYIFLLSLAAHISIFSFEISKIEGKVSNEEFKKLLVFSVIFLISIISTFLAFILKIIRLQVVKRVVEATLIFLSHLLMSVVLYQIVSYPELYSSKSMDLYKFINFTKKGVSETYIVILTFGSFCYLVNMTVFVLIKVISHASIKLRRNIGDRNDGETRDRTEFVFEVQPPQYDEL